MVKCADCLSNLTDIYNDLKINTNVWDKFNAGKEDIQKHYKDMIIALDGLQSLKMYKRLIKTYYEVFEADKLKKHCNACMHMKRISVPDPFDGYSFDEEMFICGLMNKILSDHNQPDAIQLVPLDCPLEQER